MEVSMSAINVTMPVFGFGIKVLPRFEEIFAAPVKPETTELERELISMIRAEVRAADQCEGQAKIDHVALADTYRKQLVLVRKAMREWD